MFLQNASIWTWKHLFASKEDGRRSDAGITSQWSWPMWGKETFLNIDWVAELRENHIQWWINIPGWIDTDHWMTLKIILPFLDLQMKPYRTDEYVHKLFYETSRFSAFNHQWVVKARINNSQRDPHTVNDRQITYQVRIY